MPTLYAQRIGRNVLPLSTRVPFSDGSTRRRPAAGSWILLLINHKLLHRVIVAEAGIDIVLIIHGQSEDDVVAAEVVQGVAVGVEDADGGVGGGFVDAGVTVDRQALGGDHEAFVQIIRRAEAVDVPAIGGEFEDSFGTIQGEDLAGREDGNALQVQVFADFSAGAKRF